MNPYKHSEISVKKRGGTIKDYYAIHSFMDSTKELCSDNRHRILHTHWGIRRVIIPIFGETITNSDNKIVNVKDLCEFDHILPDYRNKFIPTLYDFVEAIEVTDDDLKYLDSMIENYYFDNYDSNHYQNDINVHKLLLSPLTITGEIKSLLITHNSWFQNEVIPSILNCTPNYLKQNISPHFLFSKMKFRPWMNNGEQYPESARGVACYFTKRLFN